ncbi:iron uptake system protein EfeO [Bacillus sp. NPDC093026]|uniref:iron uptake system protein EfeO n=1 Tax=Bacillus sp. NPDC093026 TaxID=3363948 RepID=UPI0037FF28EB
MKKTILTLSTAFILSTGLAGCQSNDTKNTATKQEDSKSASSSIQKDVTRMQKEAAQLNTAIQSKNIDDIKKAADTLHNDWLSFENNVRDSFPLLYTEVEKYEQPLFMEAYNEKPDTSKMTDDVKYLQTALSTLKKAKQTKQKTSAVLTKAVKNYHTYVQTQLDELVKETTTFTAAVKAKDMKQAKASYKKARVYYERIEPIAESFGDLDPKIDARIADVDSEAKWTGFHRIEKAIWKDKNVDGQAKIADQLLKNVKELQEKTKSLALKPETMVAGAQELLNEAAISKITGEEEAYSHIDLVDLAANTEGSKAVYQAVLPALVKTNQDLSDKLDTQFNKIEATLLQLKKNGEYVPYNKLTKKQIRTLSDELSQLSNLMKDTAQIL